MKKEKIKKGIIGIQKIRMSESESSILFENLVKHINKISTASEVEPIKSNFYNRYFLPTMPRRSYFIYISYVFVGISFLGTGIIFSAMSSIPGDRLYSIKIGVVEPIEKLLAVAAIDKVNLSALKTEENLQEAARLIKNNTLNEENRSLLEQDFKKHTIDFNNFTQNYQIGDEENISKTKTYLENTIQEYSNVLNKIVENNNGEQKKEIEKFNHVLYETLKDDRSTEKTNQEKIDKNNNTKKTLERYDTKNEDKKSAVVYKETTTQVPIGVQSTSTSFNGTNIEKEKSEKQEVLISPTIFIQELSTSTSLIITGSTTLDNKFKVTNQAHYDDIQKNAVSTSSLNSLTNEETVKNTNASTIKSDGKDEINEQNGKDKKSN
ncbi:MAG: hypothetical protein WCK60_02080 [Candidatus Nomurabacteria bacterium]